MPKMELVLVRHGETDWNSASIFRGHEDVRLNAVGIAQADAVAEALKDRVFEAIHSSPLKRAMVTATRIAMPHQIDIKVNDGFVDINYGAWQGLKESTVKQKNPAAYERWVSKPTRMKFPAGDKMSKAWKRVNSALREMLVIHGLGTVVIVSHRIPLKFMTAYLLGRGYEYWPRVRHDPCAISVFTIEDKVYTPVVLNDTRHLARLKLPEQRDF
jgi:broad specificity phosphatase PhoE